MAQRPRPSPGPARRPDDRGSRRERAGQPRGPAARAQPASADRHRAGGRGSRMTQAADTQTWWVGSGSGVEAISVSAATARACPECLRRAWLLVRLAGHLDNERERISDLLDCADEDLVEAVGGSHTAEVRAEWEAFDAGAYRERCTEAGIEALCRCDPAYPAKLWDLPGEPAVLHVT